MAQPERRTREAGLKLELHLHLHLHLCTCESWAAQLCRWSESPLCICHKVRRRGEEVNLTMDHDMFGRSFAWTTEYAMQARDQS